MKQIYLFTLLVVYSFVGFSQNLCPDTIRVTGQSTPENTIFTVPNGQNGCDGWPESITVNGYLTYNLVGCNGGNLEYLLGPGQTPPSSFALTIDFGSGVVCSYDADGKPVTLSDSDKSFTDINIGPNPVKNKLKISLPIGDKLQETLLYDITGQLVYRGSNSEIDMSNISPGMYVAKIITDKGSIVKKILKN